MSTTERNPELARLSLACDPNEAADETTFTPLNEARGSSLFAEVVLQDLRETRGKRKWIFSGHVGCGKSSELRHVAKKVSDPDMDGLRYLPVFVDVKPYLDLLYITPEAIQLAIVAELADVFRALPDGGIKLDNGYFMQLFRDILNILRTPAESAEVEAGIAGFKAKFKYVFKSPSGRDKVQSFLRPQTADVLAAINDLFAVATEKLKQYSRERNALPYDDFLVIVDTLDRVLKVPDAEMGFASHKKLFLTDAAQFSELDAHMIYTVPLPLARTYAPALEDLYGTEPYVLPMVKVCSRGDSKEYQPGYGALREILRRRLGGQNPTDLIDEDAFKYLVKYTGGYVREFVAAVGKSARMARGQTITMNTVESVIANNYANYENGIKQNWLPEIIELRNDPLHRIDIEDNQIREMLEYHYILEYRNGFEDDDRKRRNTIWYALHPLVHDSEYLEHAMEALAEAGHAESASLPNAPVPPAPASDTA